MTYLKTAVAATAMGVIVAVSLSVATLTVGIG